MDFKKNIIIAIVMMVGMYLITAYFLGSIPKEETTLTNKNSVPVYFAKTYGENDYKLVVVRRKIYKDEPRLKVAISELLTGPTNTETTLGYFSEIPKSTELIELTETPNRITINLSNHFEMGGGSSSVSLRMEQFVNTVLDSAGKKSVYLEIDGESVKHLGGEGIIVPQPLSRNLNKGQNI